MADQDRIENALKLVEEARDELKRARSDNNYEYSVSKLVKLAIGNIEDALTLLKRIDTD